ncbi:protein kinase (plasmid) [Rhodococcus opacus]|uniref:protein kinase domain-containing protein n=1 Tax=Rhodococcus opacus TaxID=37919 RepID=UPI00146DD1E8|nr:protein kinase [Rhodococcus opacus]
MVNGDPLETQRDVASAVVAELTTAGFAEVHEIGHGGFGLVYRCGQPSLDRTVAVKVLTANLDEDNRARFFREQRAMGRLTGHPNIVNVLHIGTTASGRPYIVMQYHSHGSLDTRIRRQGRLELDEALRFGVKLAGALETAHRLGILHRDVKPANILLTDYDEPALTDFGIAHFAGGFETSTGTLTGSPAFTAPEVLKGEDPPSAASDIYSLGATLFSAVTGHAAFERHSGEQVVAQFLRITTQPVPDLREQGIPDDVSAAIEHAMSEDPRERPLSAAQFGDELRQSQLAHDFPVEEMDLLAEPGAKRSEQDLPRARRRSTAGRLHNAIPPSTWGSAGELPLDLTSFVGRRRELTDAKAKLSTHRLVTLTGIGGVGKTRLALRVATEARRGFSGGVRLVELGELNERSLLVDAVAAAVGIRDRSARPLEHVIVEFLATRNLLLVLDNCERLVDAVATLAENLLRTCPELRILATSREALGIEGEAVLRVPPLTIPDTDDESSLRGLPQYDAVTLFMERAAAAVSGFELTEDNRITVARICRALEGLPLPIELAAARLRAMSADQIAERLNDRYKLLTLGSRGAPRRQQTLRLSMDWSYDLCSSPEQQLWARLSVFAGTFELDAAEGICEREVAPEDLLDVLTALVDKSILIREDAGGVVRFRLLETVRDYGRDRAEQSGEYQALRQRHRDWYEKLALRAEAEWVSSQQLEWIARLGREQSNLREAMTLCLSEAGDSDTDTDTDAGLQIAAALFPFWLTRGMLTEGRYWLDRALACNPRQPTAARVKALYSSSVLAELQGDIPAATALVGEGRSLAEQIEDPMTHALVAQAEGLLAINNSDLERASGLLEEARNIYATLEDDYRKVVVQYLLGLAYGLREDIPRAIACHEKVIAMTEARGESVYRSYSLWSMGVGVWQQGDSNRAARLLEQGLRLGRLADDPITVTVCLESLAWLCDERRAKRAAVLMGAAEELGHTVGSSTVMFPHLLVHHEENKRRIRRALGERAFQAAHREGRALGIQDAIVYALSEPTRGTTPPAGTATNLTKREWQVADLVAKGLTNRAIAASLVISDRTAQGHVEHILTKLGFTSRAQIAAWFVDQTRGE